MADTGLASSSNLARGEDVASMSDPVMAQKDTS